MSLDYVHKGEAVKASTVNSIIDAFGGNQRMSPDLNVTTTARGPQVSMPSDYGGPNQEPDHILDVGRYMLSNWPMVKLELGFTLNDGLGAIRYHRADGTTSTPVSAAVVYKNSEDCPTGSDISGYALVEDDFGKDAAAHAAGWVDTMIEDPYPSGALEAQLWKYKSGAELAEVFTNVDDQLSVQQQLSNVLQANGASEEDLSTLKIVDSWKLLDSTTLSVQGQQNLVPTHEMVLKHDTIDCYEAGSFDYNVVLKASLECIDVQKDSSGEVQSTTWAWKIPLGPDADCSQGKAHSSSVTYGGNEVLFEVEEGEIGPDFSGDATYNGKAIWYGCYEAEAGEEVDADEVWLNLSYDYQLKATKGAFSSSKDSGSYTQDGILSRNVFVVKLSSFKPGADVARGDRAPAESLEHGTWGVLPKDGPKLDTYCKKDSTTEFKSLDWADREGEDVECQCAELHEFDQLETVDPLSTDHLVIRRPDDSSGAELKYISLSSLEISGMYVPPDADVPEAQTSSLQTRELDNGTNVEELFQFHLSDTVDVHISDLTSVDIVMRNPNDGQPYVQYGKLCIDIAPDAQGQTGQKSLDWLDGKNEMQLYKFDEDGLPDAFEPDVTVNSNREYLLPNEYEFVLRKNGAGGEVTYGQVALSVKMEELSGDSQASEQKSISVSNNVIELYKMSEDGQDVSSEVPTHFDEPQSILSDDCEFVIRKGGAGGEIDYTTVKLRQAMLSVDRQGHPNQKSLQYADLGDGTFLELNGFHADGTTKPKVALTSADTSLLPADNEFLIRRKVNGFWQLEYAPLSVSISGDTLVDSQVLRNQKSLEYVSGNDGDYIQLYDMDAAGQPSEQVDLKFAKDSYQDLLPDDEEFVIRTKAGGIIQYKNVGVCLSAYLSGVADAISGDNEKTPSQKSIDLVFDGDDPDYYQLHDMDKAGTSLPRKAITMSADGYTPLLPSSYEFVLRQNGAGGTIKYANLSCCIPDLSALSGDSQVSEQKSISVSNNVIELYHMEKTGKHVSSEVPTHFDEAKTILSDNYEFVVRKGGAGGEIDYTTVKLRQAKLSVDSESDDQKSIQYNPTSNELQLYKMHENGEAGHNVTITSALTPLLPADYEIVVRKNGAGGEIAYTKLSAVLSGGGIELDTQATAQQKSLEWKTQNNRTYAQLYKMDAAGEATEQVDLKFAKDSYQDLLPDDEEFVIRSAQGGEIKYKNVGVLLSAYSGGGGGSAEISVDSELPALQHSSLQHISQGGNDYYELYGFHDPTNTQTNLAGYEYVVRHNDGNGNVSVKYLSADLAAAACPASFDYYTRPDGTHWLRGGYFQQARRFYWVSSTQITAPGMIQLSVSMEYTSRSGIIQGASSLPSPNVSAMYIPLWEIGQDMKPTYDYRHAPMLPRWE